MKSSFFAGLIAAALVSTAAGETVTLNLVSEGGMKKIGNYPPLRITLSAKQPAALTKAPAGLDHPQYGTIAIAAAGAGKFLVLLDEPEGKPARLFFDTNGNGDLTDDPPVKWEAHEVAGEGGKKYQQYGGSAVLNLGTAVAPYLVTLGTYRFDKTDPRRAAQKDFLFYYRDYATEGQMKLGDKTYRVVLNDANATGDFRGKALTAAGADQAGSGVSLMIDVNGNGKFDQRGETYDVRKPFNLGGTTYEVVNVARNGLSFDVVKSSQSVAEIPLGPDHSKGKKITAFAATGTDGQPVRFPSDYKGKIVMIDFWATWCGPCMAEVPGLVQAYQKYHARGFEVLGISLDNETSKSKVGPVTKEQGMTWRQVCDGKYWNAAIAELYVVKAIPACWLVDGDTGEILAGESEMRGASLQPTLEKALAKKRGG